MPLMMTIGIAKSTNLKGKHQGIWREKWELGEMCGKLVHRQNHKKYLNCLFFENKCAKAFCWLDACV